MRDKTESIKNKSSPGRIVGKLASEYGAITLESAFVIPAAVFVVCLSIYIVLLLFEQAQLQSSADYAAQRAGSVWRGAVVQRGEEGRDTAAFEGGASSPDEQTAGLYHRTLDPYIKEKIYNAANIASVRFDSISLEGYTQIEGEAEYKNGILGKTLSVGLSDSIKLPNREAMFAFGLGNIFSNRFETVSLLPDFAENIRCIGYVMEIETKLEEASPEFAEVANSFQDIIAHIREYIGGIL